MLKKIFSLAAVLIVVLSLFQSAQAQSVPLALPAGVSPAPVRAVFAAGAYSISGFLYTDTNRNGIIDPGEPPMANVFVRLFKDNGDGVFNPGNDPLVGSQYTGADGSYSFTGLDAGLYFIKVVDQNCVLVSGGSNPRPVTLPPSSVSNNFGYLCGNPDLGVTKDDGVTTVETGGTTTYTIRVTNYGPIPAESAVLTDVAQPGLVPVSVACSTTPNNQCTSAPSLADLMGSGIYLPYLDVNWFYEIRVTASVTATSGTVTNTTTVKPPAGFNDTNPNNNTASDTDTVKNPVVDLAVTKDDGVVTVKTGAHVVYKVRVVNKGTATVTGAILTDNAEPGISLTAVACSTAAGNQCVTAPTLTDLIGTGAILPTLTPGQFYELDLSATITATDGSVTNTAHVAPPSGQTDINPSDNTSSDTDQVAPFDVVYHHYIPLLSSSSPRVFDVAVGYEDLSTITGRNDYDYNDWGLQINTVTSYNPQDSNLLSMLEMSFVPKTRGAAYDHAFKIGIPANLFTSTGTATVTTYDANHVQIGVQSFAFNPAVDNTYTIFPRTSEVFPGILVNTIEGKPYEPPQRYAKLTFTFDTPFDFVLNPMSFADPHGKDLFFNPILDVLNYTGDNVIGKGELRTLVVPADSYKWAEEGVRIDKAYPLVTYIAGTPPSFTFPGGWWKVYNHCVYDGVPCGTP